MSINEKSVDLFNNRTSSVRPFVKWAGGKSRLLTQIRKYIPKKFDMYYEPFLGGGALFFYLSVIKADQNFASLISDINIQLIETYKIILDMPEQLILELEKNEKQYYENPKKFYYKLRSEIHLKDKIEDAARFITLNKTCYNGLYRVNKNGTFNVPIGRYKKPKIYDFNNIIYISNILRKTNTTIQSGDYQDIVLNKAKEDDFIYLDPPYNPVSETSKFTNYTTNGFNYQQQERLARSFMKLHDKKCKIILSNSNTVFIRELYSEFKENIVLLDTLRSINSRAQMRSGHKELIIKNY